VHPITVDGLTRQFGAVTALDDLSFEVREGRVTGFLGANGAGKTTTLRILAGLTSADRGQARVCCKRVRDMARPARRAGFLLEPAFHPGRSGRDHLRIAAAASGLPVARVGAVLDMTGLSGAADRRAGGYSLGMRQRLGLATALLGDPDVLVLDEPGNGLDPAGIAWLRSLLRDMAGQGRTVLLSSHQLAELAQAADDVIVIARGRLVYQGSLDGFIARLGSGTRVRTPDAGAFTSALDRAGLAWQRPDGQAIVIPQARPEAIGQLAAAAGLTLHELRETGADLEQAFLELSATASTADQEARS
jgi:ABC-2 type transport system ATP-binding protein